MHFYTLVYAYVDLYTFMYALVYTFLRENLYYSWSFSCFHAYMYVMCTDVDLYRVAQKKRPEHLHALFTRAVEMNQCQSIYV